MSGFIKLRRSLIEWEWYDDHNATRLLIHLLISVNYKDKKWKGVTIKKGSTILSWETLSDACGLSVQQCRTAMKKLIDSGEVTKQVTNKYQIVTLVKWRKMQIEEASSTNKPTSDQQTSNRQVTTTKEYKESKEEKPTDKFENNDRIMNEIINNQNEHAKWIEEVYMRYRLGNKKLGVLLKDFNGAMVLMDEVKPTMKEYKRHFFNWMNIQESKGNLEHLKK